MGRKIPASTLGVIDKKRDGAGGYPDSGDPDFLRGEVGWALLLVHPVVGQAAEEDFVGGVVGVDSYAYAAGDGECVARDVEGLLQGLGDAVEAADGDEVRRRGRWGDRWR